MRFRDSESALLISPLLLSSAGEGPGVRTFSPIPASPHWAMHYPQLVSTTCVSAGMIAVGAVVGDCPGDSAPLQPWYHVLNGLPYPRIMCVSRSLACGSHTTAPAALTIRRVVHCYPSWSQECWMCLFRSSSRSGMLAIPARRRVVAISSCLCTSGHVQHLLTVAMMAAHGLEAHATGSTCSPA